MSKKDEVNLIKRPTDQECLEIMSKIRNKQYSTENPLDPEDEKYEFYVTEEDEAYFKLSYWYPSLPRLMVHLNDKEALEKAKKENAVIYT